MKFWIERIESRREGKRLFLKSDKGCCHGVCSVESLLSSGRFRNRNEKIVPIFEKALEMMKNEQTGLVETE